jgi:hypothetical protein
MIIYEFFRVSSRQQPQGVRHRRNNGVSCDFKGLGQLSLSSQSRAGTLKN